MRCLLMTLRRGKFRRCQLIDNGVASIRESWRRKSTHPFCKAAPIIREQRHPVNEHAVMEQLVDFSHSTFSVFVLSVQCCRPHARKG